MLYIYLKVFLSRIVDVCIGTIRTMYVIKGSRIVSTILAFFEVLIWFYAAKLVFTTDSNIYVVIFYSLGFALGSYLGSLITDLFIDGIYNIEVISDKITLDDVYKIKKHDIGLSVLKTIDDKYILHIVVRKKRYNYLLKLLKKFDSNAFVIVNDSKLVLNGYIKK